MPPPNFLQAFFLETCTNLETLTNASQSNTLITKVEMNLQGSIAYQELPSKCLLTQLKKLQRKLLEYFWQINYGEFWCSVFFYFQPFRGHFNSSLIHWAICIPSTCQPDDAVIILRGLLNLFVDFGEIQVEVKEKDCYFEVASSLSTGQLIYG